MRNNLAGNLSQIWVAISLMALAPCSVTQASETDEYARKTVTSFVGDTLIAGVPFSAASAYSMTECIYTLTDLKLCGGDIITGVTFIGRNLGGEQTRHLTVWMENTDDMFPGRDFADTGRMTKVFDGNAVMAATGTTPSDVFTIEFDTPLVFAGYNVRLTVLCDDGQAGEEVLFRQSTRDFRYSLFKGNASDDSERLRYMPEARFMVDTPVKYVSGTVVDENSQGIAGAQVRLHSSEWNETYETTTDGDGSYLLRIEEGNKSYLASASAPGHTCHADMSRISVSENPQLDFLLYGTVTYPGQQRSTIILPVAPDASAGRYYRLSHCEDNRICFERELAPQANTPYILFADQDYYVDLQGMDLTLSPGSTHLDSVSFAGSYSNGIELVGWYVPIRLDAASNTGDALHAKLYLPFMMAYNYELVFVEVPDAISPVTQTEHKSRLVYDLSGRPMYISSGSNLRIYDGRKVLVK